MTKPRRRLENRGTYDGGMLPEITVTGYAPLRLKTYYPIISNYPYTGHSKLDIPINEDVWYDYVGEKSSSDRTSPYVTIDKKSNANNYNLITNNCADATLNYLTSAFGIKENPYLFTTPGDVRSYAINKLKGKVVNNRDGSDTVLIPRNKSNSKRMSKLALDMFDKDVKRTVYVSYKGPFKYKNGGSIHITPSKRRIHLDEVKPYVIPTDNIQTIRPDTIDVEYPNFVFSRNNPNFGIYTGLGYNAYGEMIDYNNNGVPASQEYVIDKIKTKYYKNPSQRRVNNAKKAIGVRPDFKNGGSIHIDPSNKGTFTAAASKHNMGVQEFASRVLRNKENYSPAMVKKANFARNASKWH